MVREMQELITCIQEHTNLWSAAGARGASTQFGPHIAPSMVTGQILQLRTILLLLCTRPDPTWVATADCDWSRLHQPCAACSCSDEWWLLDAARNSESGARARGLATHKIGGRAIGRPEMRNPRSRLKSRYAFRWPLAVPFHCNFVPSIAPTRQKITQWL